MEWAKLLSTEKLSSEPPEPDSFKEYPINAFEKDYSRIVSSAAFRRLQDKTQVFPLDKSDFIRTRLTHSIEVSTIARQLGIMISKNTTQYKPTDIAVPEDAEAIASVLLCAGLLHDLGNPPFGHFGETVIGDWFKENLDHVKYKGRSLRSWLSEQMIADLENFEGNAQALRILLKAKHGSSLNLSKAIISTLVKYPTDSCSVDKGSADIRKHKLGFFAAEQETFEQISEAVGTATPDKGIVRHPLTYLLEAADDIAYSTADLEDAFKKGLFTLDQFIEYYTNSYDHSKIVPHRSPEYFSDEQIQELSKQRGADHTPENDSAAFKKWLTQTRQWLMYVAIYRFSCKYKEIMAGTYCGDLFEGTNHAITIDILKGAMRKFAFDTPGILKLELSGQVILDFLLDHFVPAVLYYDSEYCTDGQAPSKADKKLLAIFSGNYKQDYQNTRTGTESFDLYLRLLMVTDDRFSGWVFHDQSIIHGIHDSPFQLMVEVHRSLPLMAYGIIVQKLLIRHSGNLAQLQIRCQLFYEDTACECERLKRDGVRLQHYMGSEVGHILHLMDLAEDKLKMKFLTSIFLSGIALAISLIVLATS